MNDDLILSSWTVGNLIDLTECTYGLWHDNVRTLGTPPYYHFLAGLASELRATNVIEIGTYRGGSTKALVKGMKNHCSDANRIKMYTVDVQKQDIDFATFQDSVHYHIGDPLAAHITKTASELFGQHNAIDILFIDGAHDGPITMAQTLHYDKLFKPRCIVWDDVNLNSSMREFFVEISKTYPNSKDISISHPEIRRPDEGFGFLMKDI